MGNIPKSGLSALPVVTQEVLQGLKGYPSAEEAAIAASEICYNLCSTGSRNSWSERWTRAAEHPDSAEWPSQTRADIGSRVGQ